MRPAALLSLAAMVAMSPDVAWTAEANSLADPPVQDANGVVRDRGSFFIGNTIENLRGQDPVFGGRKLTLVDGRRLTSPEPVIAPAMTFTNRALSLPANWTESPISQRRSCGAYGCSGSVDLLVHRADGTTRVFSTNLSGEFIALPRSHQIFDCAEGVSTSQPMSPAIVDLNGTKTMLPSHPGALLDCVSAGTGDEVLLVYSMAKDGKAYTLARVFGADGAQLAEGAYAKAGSVKFRVAGKRHSAVVPGPGADR